MLQRCVYQLGEIPRLYAFPFRLAEIGWMPDHSCAHRGRRLTRLFACVVYSREEAALTEVNGVLESAGTRPRLSILPPGTVLTSLHEARHDELFFSYDEPAASALAALGFTTVNFALTPQIEAVTAEIRSNLAGLHLPGVADRLDLLALRLLTECSNASRQEGSRDRRIAEIASFLALHFTEEIDWEKLWAKHGFSRRSFFRAWAREFSVSPVQFLTERRLGLAENLLRGTDSSLEEIAHLTGFGSSSYLIERFRRRFGLSPRRYRERPATAPEL